MIEVLATGPLATVQDLGRPGYQQLGVSRSGAADRSAHRLANRLVGNLEVAATVEIALGGLSIRLLAAATLALTGAPCSGAPAWNSPVSLPAGSRVALAAPATGLRSYLAVRGGLAVPAVLGSRSTDLLAGLGPPALAAGARLPIGSEVAGEPAGEPVIPRPIRTDPVRVLPGPRQHWLTDPAELYAQAWTVRADSNRIGIRLAGRPVRRRAGEVHRTDASRRHPTAAGRAADHPVPGRPGDRRVSGGRGAGRGRAGPNRPAASGRPGTAEPPQLTLCGLSGLS